MVPIGKTERTPGRRLGPIFGFGVPGAVLGLATAWMLGAGPARGVQAEGGPTQGSAGGLMALTTSAPGDPGGTRLVLIDQRTQAMAIYKIDGFKGGSIKLEAARQFGPDLRLSEYNNLPPEVAAVEAMVAAPRPRGISGQ
ncbi:hypothetical protein [Tautonia plasticadhaerens]|uniref:Uncharacterized protein n=1 Tax=Tautonia plasticadhaerens TaxID=2527974 RepID=A0A518HAK4_9BACT|nr:hypothetical protein [Tautonia plasticadhaerens]QDV37881.1 hypothetical protein ElP_58280 [Tautonia plasticadhaerens]